MNYGARKKNSVDFFLASSHFKFDFDSFNFSLSLLLLTEEVFQLPFSPVALKCFQNKERANTKMHTSIIVIITQIQSQLHVTRNFIYFTS